MLRTNVPCDFPVLAMFDYNEIDTFAVLDLHSDAIISLKCGTHVCSEYLFRNLRQLELVRLYDLGLNAKSAILY